jgi:methyl-CpG-binding domain protein 4
VQEKVAHDPFRLLVAVTLLIKTKGRAAIPTFWKLVEKFPTPESFSDAEVEDIEVIIRHLGLGKKRAGKIRDLARTWIERPPKAGVRYPVGGGYEAPLVGSQRDFDVEDENSVEVVIKIEGETPEKTRKRSKSSLAAWEIGHLTEGRYTLDSWRIFCRDELLWGHRGTALADSGCKRGDGEEKGGKLFQPEWMRVLPRDKELRAYLRWMWMKEGWEWNPETGDKEVLREEMQKAVEEGRVVWDEAGELSIVSESATPYN